MNGRKYFKFDEVNQFLEHESDINYFSLNQARRVAVGNMLGDFDQNGFYVVDEKITKQLIAMPKIIVDSLEDVDLIRSAVKFDNYLHFMLVVSENKASLILLEKINFESNAKYNAGSYSNMNEYVLDEITIPDRDVDKNAIYTKFNIMRADEGKYYDINDFTEEEQQNFSAIISKMKFNLLAQNQMLKSEKSIEIIEADYFDNVLASIKLYPKIYAEFEKLLSSMILEKREFIQINKPFFQKTINEILDNCLRLLFTKLSPEIREILEKKIREIKDNYYKEYNKIIHFQFIISNAKQEVNKENMISEVVNEKEQSTTLLKVKIEEEKLENSFASVVDENEKLKKEVAKENSDSKDIKKDNPVLTKFFKDVKTESGVDMLKPEVKEEKTEVKKEEPKKEKVEEKKVEQKPKVVEVKKQSNTQQESSKIGISKEVKLNNSAPKNVNSLIKDLASSSLNNSAVNKTSSSSTSVTSGSTTSTQTTKDETTDYFTL